MNIKPLLLGTLLLSVPVSVFAQDKIYKRNGEIIEAKVTELSYIDISYKRHDNPDGPVYTISKKDVTRIVYENGVDERIKYGLRRSPNIDLNKKRTLDCSHNNIIAVTPLNISQSGIGFGLTYEHLFGKKGRFAFYLPVNLTSLGFDNSNNDIAGPGRWLFAIGRNRSILQVAPGVKFYPTGNRGMVRYAVGAQVMYGGGYMVEREFNYSRYNPGPITNVDNPYKNLRVMKLGAMLNNSLNINSGKHFYFGADFGLGITVINKKEVFSTGEMKQKPENGLAQFSIRLGYRF